MGKPYINNAVIGNGKILGCISKAGELIRLYWPHIGHDQHIEKFLTGIYDVRYKNSTKWFSEGDYERFQYYIDKTNILKTVAVDRERKLRIELTDFCLIDKDVVVRNYEIINEGEEDFDLGFAIASHAISYPDNPAGTFFDFSNEALVHYKKGYYISISADLPANQFQIGNDPFGAAWHGKLNGYDNIGMSPDAALSWHVGLIKPGKCKSICVKICFSATLKGIKLFTKRVRLLDFNNMLKETNKYWKNFLKSCQKKEASDANSMDIYMRSLLVFALMSDKKTGAILASPEVDETFSKCGRYGYCWTRDAAFITEALDSAGLNEMVDKFYDWVSKVQDKEGYWHQRYYIDGNIAPSWGIQIDETASVIVGILNHYRYTKNKAFLNKMWSSVNKAMSFLMKFIDTQTGLPYLSFDIWEERFGEHAYSSAAVFAGAVAAAEIGEILGKSQKLISSWLKFSKGIKSSIINSLWSEKRGHFLRSIKVKLNPFGEEPPGDTLLVEVNEKGYKREVSLEDVRMDISLLGLTVPFKVFSPDSPKILKTVERLESTLLNHESGGVMRYEGDQYIGGNPWILATFWLALYYIEKEDIKKAKEYFDWVQKTKTHLNFLAEQADKYTGRPNWVIPLTWSHAMYVLVFNKLAEAGEI